MSRILMGGFDFQKCPTGTLICRRIQPIGVHPCFTTIISSTGRYGSSYKKSRASADDGRVSRSVEDVDPTVQMEIQGSKVGGEPAGGEAGEGRNVRMMRHLKQIGAFGLPAVMVPLADPVMSLIDTISLGQMAGSVQLAALAPCTLLFNFTFYSFSALSVATISLVAELHGHRPDQAGDTLTAALLSAAFGGLLICFIMLSWGPTLLAATGCDPSLVPFSWQYLRIRAFAAPAAILTQVCQGGLLAQRDSVTPFKVVFFSLALSLAGDLYLVGVLQMGLVGAALTTVAAQYVSSALLLRSLFLSKTAPTIRFPKILTFSNILHRASGLGIFYVAKTTSYLLLQASATRLPPLMLAAHQTIWQIWGVCSFMNTPLEQAALTFIPIARSETERRELIVLLLSLGAMFGVLCAIVAHGLPAIAPGLLVSDQALWPLLRSVWVPGTLALFACGLDVSSTGVLLASREVSYVARSMIVSLTVLATYFTIIAMQGPFRIGIMQLKSVWWGLSIFFLARVLQSFPRAVSKIPNLKNLKNYY